MSDVFKNFLYAGVGLAAMAQEKIEATVDELIEKGKITDLEGKQIIEDFIENSEVKKNEFEDKLKGITEEVVSKFNIGNNSEVEDLRARVEELEAMVAEATKAKTTTKTAASKKTTTK